MSLHQSLRVQVLTLLGGSLLLMLIIALGSTHILSSALQDYRSLLQGPILASEFINEANLQFKIQVQEWKNVLLRGKQATALDKYWQQFEHQERLVQSQLAQLANLPTLDASFKSQVKQLQETHLQLGEAYRRGKDSFLSAGADPTAGDRAVQGVDRAASEQMSHLVQQLLEHSRQYAQGIEESSDFTIQTSIILIVLADILIGISSLWLINHYLVAPVQQLIQYTRQLSQGRFSQQVHLDRQDELGQLASAVNRLRDFLAETFEQLGRSAQALDQTSSHLKDSSTRMAKGAEQQSNQTDRAAQAMNELSQSTQGVSQHAAEAARAADSAEAAARQGELVMENTIHTITRIREEIGTTAQVIQQLEHDSSRISKVLEVIRGIAEQTNLLALNAAIEAARAGEAGRGFAVVADEVRTLASRTAESTAEIHQIIDTVQTGALNAVKAIESGQTRTEEGVTQVTKAGSTLQAITQAVDSIRAMNQQIATAADEQTRAAAHISQSLTEITHIAQSNQEDVQRTEAASQDLLQQSAQLGQVIASLGR